MRSQIFILSRQSAGLLGQMSTRDNVGPRQRLISILEIRRHQDCQTSRKDWREIFDWWYCLMSLIRDQIVLILETGATPHSNEGHTTSELQY